MLLLLLFLDQIGDAVGRSAPAATSARSSPPSTLSTSPQAALVSDLNDIISKLLTFGIKHWYIWKSRAGLL